jgi:hypothetical protein
MLGEDGGVTFRLHAARAWALLVCVLVACAVIAVPAASAAPPTQTTPKTSKHGKHPHAKGAHGKRAGATTTRKHANHTAHPHRPTHPGTRSHGAGRKTGRSGQHGNRSNLPVSIAPPPKVHVPTVPAGDPAKSAALWATPLKVPKKTHASRARIAPTWMVAIPGAALAVLAAGGLIHLVRRRGQGAGPASAAS